jgi:hypothetical protein
MEELEIVPLATVTANARSLIGSSLQGPCLKLEMIEV